MDPEFAAVIFVEETRKLHLKSSNEIKVSWMDRVICMETGLPNKDIFQIVVSYVERFKDSVNYFYNWKVECLSLEDLHYPDETSPKLHQSSSSPVICMQ